ncbi:MAG: alpha/beta fold hydrolase [Candidatus Thermoplasmatota archaeon]|nr:alpha/beta fold hydrolase [Candidatus Thermoplasmatota archaeon]
MDLKGFMETRGFDPLSQDPPQDPEGPLTRNERLNILSGGCLMNGLALLPQGKGPHPSVLFLHGFPGHETNLDMAHALRRAGFACFLFHYRGSWGSEGSFSFGNMVDDTRCALEHIAARKDELHLNGFTFVIGFSMGGWAAIMASAGRTDVHGIVWMAGANLGPFKAVLEMSEEARKKAVQTFSDSLGPLKGTTEGSLLKEVMGNGDEWDLCVKADDLKHIPLLLIKARRDTTAVPSVHFDPFHASLKASGHRDIDSINIDSDHNFTGKRLELTRAVMDWVLRTYEKIIIRSEHRRT